jgi:transaldolase/glucose-6-phosphate isomerase
VITARYHLGELEAAVEAAAVELAAADAVTRLWGRDHTLFQEDPADCANRLGWLDSPTESSDVWDGLVAFAAEIAGESDDVVLMGMGGSSLFPEVLTRTFGSAEGFPNLHVIDSTDPDAVRRVLEATDPARTFHVASSKSGTTLETRSHLDLFWERSGDPDRFAVITDPGSALGELARARGFRHVFENNPDIGGRYAALSLFGMVPAALIDADGDAILEAALDMADALEPLGDGDDADGNIGLRLGAAFGAAARAGRDQLTIVLTPALESFGLWLEQLVAESTGKHGDGIIPIVGEPIPDVCATPDRRLLVTIGDVEGIAELRASGAPLIELSLEELHDVGAQVLLWEVAVALAGKVLGINPFDQPDVEAAKAAARELLDADAPPAPPVTPLADALAAIGPGDLLAVCAFVDPGSDVADDLEEFRSSTARRLGVASTLGFGPRFLHSTGQLHKGGPASIVVVQVCSDPAVGHDLEIPGQTFTFGTFKAAQAAGDLAALHASGHRAFRVSLEEISRG